MTAILTTRARAALLSSAAIAILAVAGQADAAAKHRHHATAAASNGGDIKALTEEVEALEGRLAAEGQAREALQSQVQAAQAQAAQAQADAQSAHNELASQIQTIPGVVDSEVAKTKPKPSWADNTKVGATVFANISNINQTPNVAGHPATKDGTGADIKRAYVSIDHSFNDIYSANLTVDLAPQDASQTLGGTSVNQGAEAIKYAYVQAKYSKELIVQLGGVKAPWIPFVEDIYGYRYIDKVVIDQNKFGNSSDWGANVHGAFANGLFEYSASASDGQGYKNPDRSQQMDFEGRVNVNWNGFIGAIGGYTGKLGEDVQNVPSISTRTATREDALLAYVNSKFRLGAEWFQSENTLTSGALVPTTHAADKADGYSLFGAFNFTPQWALFGRYDAVSPSKDIASSERYDYYNVGIQYEPVKTVDLGLVYKHEEVTHAPSGGYTDATTTLAPAGGSGHYDEVGVFTQFKF